MSIYKNINNIPALEYKNGRIEPKIGIYFVYIDGEISIVSVQEDTYSSPEVCEDCIFSNGKIHTTKDINGYILTCEDFICQGHARSDETPIIIKVYK